MFIRFQIKLLLRECLEKIIASLKIIDYHIDSYIGTCKCAKTALTYICQFVQFIKNFINYLKRKKNHISWNDNLTF